MGAAAPCRSTQKHTVDKLPVVSRRHPHMPYTAGSCPEFGYSASPNLYRLAVQENSECNKEDRVSKDNMSMPGHFVTFTC